MVNIVNCIRLRNHGPVSLKETTYMLILKMSNWEGSLQKTKANTQGAKYHQCYWT